MLSQHSSPESRQAAVLRTLSAQPSLMQDFILFSRGGSWSLRDWNSACLEHPGGVGWMSEIVYMYVHTCAHM